MFTGGDQILICKALLKSNFLNKMKKRFEKDKHFLISGNSAGAMALSEVMIAGGSPSQALKKGHIQLSEGLGLLPRIIVDTHFIKRERFARLIEAVSIYPQKLGIGLAENTAVFFKKVEMVETIGSNLVILVDPSQLSYNNIKYINHNDPICLENLKLHILPKNHKFNILKRKIYNISNEF